MTIEELQIICKKFPGVTFDIKWEDHLCFNVGKKMFIITSPDTVPVSASIKVTEDNFEKFATKEGFKPAAYLARHKWIYIDNISRLTKKEWEELAKQAYTLIASKLPAKIRKEINLNI